MPNTPIVNAGTKYLYGLRTERTGLKLITIYPGAARDSNNINDIILEEEITVNGATTGANGVDVAVIAGGLYALYLIGDSTGYYPTAGLLSLDFEQPSLPTGYDMYRRIGYNFVQFTGSLPFATYLHVGEGNIKTYYYGAPTEPLTAGASTTYAEIDLELSVPPAISEMHAQIVFNAATPGNLAYFTTNGFSPSGGMFVFGGTATTQGVITLPVSLNESGAPSIFYKVSNASDSLTLRVCGFVDYL